MVDQDLRTTVTSKQFDQAIAMLKEHPECFSEMNKWNQNFIIAECMRQKAYTVINTLIEEELVITDVFELDTFSGSFIETVMSNLPFYAQPLTIYNSAQLSQETPDAEALAFLEKFVAQIENIDEWMGRETLLLWALTKQLPLPAIEILINAGCDINQYDNVENSLLHLNLPAKYAEFLLNSGLEVDMKNKGNVTPLQKAIDNGNVEVVRLLLDNGANPQHKDKDGNSLFYVALYDKLNFEIYDVLCEFDTPNFEEKNQFGRTLLFDFVNRMDAYSSKQAISYLSKILEQGADMLQPCTIYNESKSPLDIAITKPQSVFEIFFNQLPIDINDQDDNGDTILHKLCGVNLNFEANKAKDLYRKVKLVLKNGADKAIRNNQDQLPLDLATDDNLKEKIVILLMN
ncbi:ankyrin repeat domain-containing protein [Flavobacterium sp. CBA20B-1]|uniref:ankyrin repeat domain-containing protein n=1 Tax=unclassified Flavobacterium TaxID=196869 RepID=UPI002225A108|nr:MULTISPECIES: ankyrin repeat domain-containing protein [unclassified Flavobacterium]WCM41263.1 ankyrin repeat domain-containing protein [Flavobacterium sp. CBA20B-1]